MNLDIYEIFYGVFTHSFENNLNCDLDVITYKQWNTCMLLSKILGTTTRSVEYIGHWFRRRTILPLKLDEDIMERIWKNNVDTLTFFEKEY